MVSNGGMKWQVSYYATMHPLIMLCASVYFYVK
eukprot:COSAG05_NODE_877_length_6812_cov_6.263370_9_plen_33_part_00